MAKRKNVMEKWHHIKYDFLVIATEDFIVFIDDDLDIDWETTHEYDQKGHNKEELHNSILNRAAIIECIPNAQQNKQIRNNFKRMIGEGIARSLSHDYDSANKILDEAEAYITARNIEKARYWQLWTTIICGLVTVIIATILWIFRFDMMLHIGSVPFYISFCAFFGSLGATLSIVFRIGSSNITSEANILLHILESISKNIGGCIAGLIISIFIKIGILFPIFKSIDMTNYAMIAGAILAGASERWAPSIVSQFGRESSSIDSREDQS